MVVRRWRFWAGFMVFKRLRFRASKRGILTDHSWRWRGRGRGRWRGRGLLVSLAVAGIYDDAGAFPGGDEGEA